MFKKHTLKNGLRVITIPMRGTKTATVLVMVGTGSKYETGDINGISHFLEHMAFKGTEKRPTKMEISSELDRVGAEYNAFTGKEYTGYYVKVGYKYLNLALDVVSDILLNSRFSPKEINKEKGVIVEELRMYRDTPTRYVHDIFEKLLYGNQPAGWDTGGRESTIRAMFQNKIKDYYQNHYLAKNIVVTVTGNFEDRIILREIKKYFHEIKRGIPKSKLKTKEKQNSPRVSVNYKKTDQTHLILGVRAFDLFDKRRFVLGLLATILGGNMSSRLFTEIRDRRGLAYYISSSPTLYSDSGYLATGAGVNNAKIEEAIKAILAEYKKLVLRPVSEEELQKAKDYEKGTTLINLEASDELAGWAAGQEILRREILSVEDAFKKIDEVTTKDIQEVAKEIFRPEKLNLALIGPFKDKHRFQRLLRL